MTGTTTTTTEARSTWERASAIIEQFTGERYGDGVHVMDVYDGYNEPGYRDDSTTLVIAGNWNPRRFPRDGDPPLTDDENIGPRLAEALDAIDGVDLVWYDEWIDCTDCHRAIRVNPDSYAWQPYHVWTGDGYTCLECVDLADVLDGFGDDDERYVDNPRKALMGQHWSNDDIRAQGFTPHTPPDFYESGWHPGQDDDPRDVLAALKAEEDVEVLFVIAGIGQFDTRWTAWTRPIGWDGDDE